MALTQVSSNKCAGGFQKVFEHESTELKCKMKFAVYLPPKAETDKCPVMYWLSGLTCTEQNFITKAGSQLAAAEHGIIIVAPDTSPRGCNIEGEDENWDFGTGAGFYVNATQDPWKTNYRMYAYVTEELPKLINANFPTDPDRMSVSGHSMGGHGALICALKNPGKYKAVSAFAPICNPMQCPWGQKAFAGYLGSDRSTWEAYDATVLAASYSGPQLNILIDQGQDDQFLSASQLLPDNLIAVCSEKKIPVVFRLQPTKELQTLHNLLKLLVQDLTTQVKKVMTLIQDIPVPVIAMVNGVATAAGCQLVASCDVAVVTEKSTFATPGVNVGLFCSTPAVAIGRAVPRKVAMEMLFTGTPISAHDALLHGLVSKVVPEERLEEETLSIAKRVCQASRPVVALGKATFQRQMAQGRDAAYATASKVMVDNLALTDGQEGIRAFIEKRKPVWSHKVEKAHD